MTSLQSHPQIIALEEVFLLWQLKSCLKPVEIIQMIYDSYPSKVRGFKITYSQARKVDSPIFGDDDVWCELQRQKDIKIIHSVRANGLARIISWKIGMTTGMWQYYSNSDRSLVRIRIEPEECEKTWSFCDEKEKQIDQDFSEHDLLKIQYNDLAQNQTEVLKTVQEFLGVEVRTLTSPLVKSLRPFVLENLNDLKEHFKNTKWEWFFSDFQQ